MRTVFAWLRATAKRELGLSSAAIAHPGAVTVIQRASSHLALNPHFLHAAGSPCPAASGACNGGCHCHSLITDGVFVVSSEGPVAFVPLPAPTATEFEAVAQRTCRKTLALLHRRGLWTGDPDDPLADATDPGDPALTDLQAASVRGVLAVGPRAGRCLEFYGQAAELD